MTERVIRLAGAAVLGMSVGLFLPFEAHAQTVKVRYEAAQAREVTALESIATIAASAPTTTQMRVIADARAVIAMYEALVQRYRASGYADNALFNAAGIAKALHDRFGQTRDLDTAIRLYRRVAAEYPTSSLAKQVTPLLSGFVDAEAPARPAPSAAAAAITTPPVRPTATATAGRARLMSIERAVIADTVRVTLQLDREVPYYEEKLAGPSRVFFDFKGIDAVPELVDAVLRYPTDVVRQIRIGRHRDQTVRVVLDLEGVTRHTVYTLYNPFRLVIDAESATALTQNPAPLVATPVARAQVARPPVAPSAVRPGSAVPPPVVPNRPVAPIAVATADPEEAEAATLPSRLPVGPAPAPPAVNRAGGLSIARQLGLGVSRVVIDAGHGGHDPGAQAKGLNEADLTLDLALRLEEMLLKEPGLEVVLTRRSDVYVSLEERTAIANREGADLFLSIHANTSRSPSARGVETYFLSFAGSADAEAVAARENAAYAGEMHKLPDIIKAITLNNKLDESRDLAGMVQEALVARLRRSNKNVDNRGVKKAPFVVLIGAEMPSVLAEVSFMTNKQELSLLKTAAYKQRIAEALHAAVMRYRRALKGARAVAAQ